MGHGDKKCPLARLRVTAQRTPAPVGGPKAFDVNIKATKLDDPNKNKTWAVKAKCDSTALFKSLAEGKYRITASIPGDDKYTFVIADAVDVDLVKKDPAMTATVPIKPITITEVTPTAAWKQYVNLELTAYEQGEGRELVTHDVQEKRAAAAKIAANTSGMDAWKTVATRLEGEAPGKRMDAKQLGRVLEITAKVTPKKEGAKVYFGIAAGANPAWTGVPDELRAALSSGSGSKWKTDYDKKLSTKTDAQGVAKVRFRLSRFGGDKFKVAASLDPDPINSTNVKSADITVWRKIWYQPSYSKDYPLYSLAGAQADYAGGFVELEEIDTRPYEAGAGGGAATESPAWQFDEGKRKGPLKPGDSMKFEAVVESAKVGGLPATADITVKEKSPGTAEILRKVAVRKPAALSVTEADVTLANKPVRSTFAPLTNTFRVRNGGDAKLAYTVSKTQSWAKLSRNSGTVAGGANEAVDVVLDGVALSNLAPGDYEETITFTNSGKPTETVTKKVKLKVDPNTEAALTISPPDGLTLLGQAGGPFTGGPSQTYTLVNRGGKKLSFSAFGTNVPWLTVDYAARRALIVAAKKAEVDAKKADEDAKALELLAVGEPTKKGAATDARQKADEAAQAAKDAKERADDGVGELDPGASTTVDVAVDGTEAAKLGALPATATVTFRDRTGSGSQDRTVKLAKPAVLAVTGANVAKTKPAGSFDATSGAFALKNDGDVDLAFTVTADKPWVSLDVASGTIAAGATVNVTATVNLDAANTFEVGDETAALTIRDTTNGVDVAKEVKLTVTANPAGVMAVTPWDEMECLGHGGGPFAPPTRIYTIKNIGGAAMKVQVSQDKPWLKTSTPGSKIAVGDHNKMPLQNLRQQAAGQRPPTIQLLVCQAQCDPETSEAIAKSSATRSLTFDDTEVLNDDNDAIEVQNPAIDGKAVITKGKWKWDGHTGGLVGHDDYVVIERGRGTTSDVVLNLPAVCGPDCKKVGCPKGVAINPAGGDEIRVTGLQLHGYRSFLGEGGYHNRPTCLIVAKENMVDDFNDTVSHEIGHMIMAVAHTAADHQKEVDEAKESVRDNRKDLTKAKRKKKNTTNIAKIQLAVEQRLKHRMGNHSYYWPGGEPVHTKQYDDGQGNHCHEGASNPNPGKYENGTCVLYASGRDVKLNWCAQCTKYIKFVDLRRFALSE